LETTESKHRAGEKKTFKMDTKTDTRNLQGEKRISEGKKARRKKKESEERFTRRGNTEEMRDAISPRPYANPPSEGKRSGTT